MNVIAAFLSAFFYVVFTQNLVFTGGYGASEVIRSAARPRQILIFSIMIVYFSTFTSLICRLLLLIPSLKTASTTLTLVVYTAVLTVLYLVTVCIFRALLANSTWKQVEKEKFIRQTSIAAFNTIVFAVPFINQKVAYSVSESVAQGIGAGVSFVIATVLVHLGMRKIESDKDIPDSFKGTPALFMYIAILALAFTGVSGKSLFF